MIGSINHGPCKNNVTNKWEFCTVYNMGKQTQQIHPIGFCREGNKKGLEPCNHRTEEEAINCYKKYEVETFATGMLDPKDLLYPEHMVGIYEAFLVLIKEAALTKLENQKQ